MHPTLRTITTILATLLLPIGCDYELPAIDEPSSTNYAPARAVKCVPFGPSCKGAKVCCIDGMNFNENKCTETSSCVGTALGCDGAEDCSVNAVCCGVRPSLGGPITGARCTEACGEPNVRICRTTESSATCLPGSVCVQVNELPPEMGMCQPTPP